MSRYRSQNKRIGGNRAYLVIVGAIIAVLVLGTLAGVLADQGDSNDDPTGADVAVTVTPGAEIARLETQVAANPDDLDSLIVLAEILANSGRSAEAIPLFEAAVARKPTDSTLRLAFGRTLLRTNNLFDAEIQLVKATELAPSDQAAAFYLAQTYEAGGERRREDARLWYQKTIELKPDSLIAEQAQQALDLLGAPATAIPGDQGQGR